MLGSPFNIIIRGVSEGAAPLCALHPPPDLLAPYLSDFCYTFIRKICVTPLYREGKTFWIASVATLPLTEQKSETDPDYFHHYSFKLLTYMTWQFSIITMNELTLPIFF